jgi:hypothetical protein
MKSSKWILGLMVAVLVMALAPSSFAQVNIQIFNTPSPQENQTTRNAQTSDPSSVGNGILVSGALIATSPLTATSLTFTFPGTITSSAGTQSCVNEAGTAITNCVAPGTPVPTADPIVISGATGLFTNVSIASVNFNNGTVQIILPAASPANPNSTSGTFRLVGVRIDANGKTAPMNATAALGSSSNNYILQTTTIPIITALGAGLGNVAIGSNGTNTNQGTALIFTNQTNATFADANASVVIGEGFASAWRTTTQVGTQGVPLAGMNGTLVQLTINGLPSGVTANLTLAGRGGVTNAIAGSTTGGVSFYGTAAGGNTTLSLQPPSGSSPNRNTGYIQFNVDSLTAVESLEIDINLTGTPTSLAAGTITMDVTMGPVGPALFTTPAVGLLPAQGIADITPAPPAGGTALVTGYVRFASAPTTVTIGSIIAANTTMLIPYAIRVGAYDTGIAIANTTLDPFGASSGGATPAAGTMTFTMFPRNATGADPSFAITTSSTVRPGVGLSTSGTLVAGGTWTGLMSDIMTAAGKTGNYFGYIFIQTNFLNAHGAAYIFNGAGFTSSTNVLVLQPPASVSRNTTGAESLSF